MAQGWKGNLYLASNGRMMAVEVKTAPQFEAGAPQELFDPQMQAFGVGDAYFHYDVSADGKRFLVDRVAADVPGSAPTPITVIVNWPAALKR